MGDTKKGIVEIGKKIFDQSGNGSISKDDQSNNSCVKDTYHEDGNQSQILPHEIVDPMVIAYAKKNLIRSNVDASLDSSTILGRKGRLPILQIPS